MQLYVGLLRGVNVGGKAVIKMTDLKTALEKAGLVNVQTYIQSGNVIFESDQTIRELESTIQAAIKKSFGIESRVVVFTQDAWHKIIAGAPDWWGQDTEWKHNIVVLLPPTTAVEAARAIGELKPDIERAEVGHGVIYQSISWKFFGRTTSGKLASNPIYKEMTIRNYNTAHKLQALMHTRT